MDMRRLVGTNVKRLRLARGWTQEEFSVRSGVSQQYISGLEHGRRNPTVVTVHHLAEAFGVSYLELLTPFDDPTGGDSSPG